MNSRKKKKNIMSLSGFDEEMKSRLEVYAKSRGIASVSKLIRDLVDKYLIMDDEIIPVILKIPANLKGDEVGLRQWMDSKSGAIVKALSNN